MIKNQYRNLKIRETYDSAYCTCSNCGNGVQYSFVAELEDEVGTYICYKCYKELINFQTNNLFYSEHKE